MAITRAYRLSRLAGVVVLLAGLTHAAAGETSPSASAIALGWIHTCALTGSGGVMCWGYKIGLTRRGLEPLASAERLPVRARARFGQPDGTTSETSRRITLNAG